MLPPLLSHCVMVHISIPNPEQAVSHPADLPPTPGWLVKIWVLRGDWSSSSLMKKNPFSNLRRGGGSLHILSTFFPRQYNFLPFIGSLFFFLSLCLSFFFLSLCLSFSSCHCVFLFLPVTLSLFFFLSLCLSFFFLSLWLSFSSCHSVFLFSSCHCVSIFSPVTLSLFFILSLCLSFSSICCVSFLSATVSFASYAVSLQIFPSVFFCLYACLYLSLSVSVPFVTSELSLSLTYGPASAWPTDGRCEGQHLCSRGSAVGPFAQLPHFRRVSAVRLA